MIPCTLVHASYDEATAFASRCATDVKAMLVSAKFDVFEIQGTKACKEHVHKHLQGFLKEVHGFLNYGHGNERALIGHNGEALLDVNSAGLLNNKICYALSCLAAKEFGRQVVSSGGICFLGYNGEFEYSPLCEGIFRECANSGIKAMVQTKATAGEAFEIMKVTFDRMISHLAKYGEGGSWFVLISLLRDRNYLELLGNTSASFWQTSQSESIEKQC